jgi:nicotinamide mononucleotide (NMN) deamidase PncC
MARGSSEAIAAWISLAISGAIGRYGEATAAHAETALITASREHEKRPIRSSRAAHADKSRSQRSAPEPVPHPRSRSNEI